MPNIARTDHSSSCIPVPGFCRTGDKRDMYILLNMLCSSLPVLVAGKTLLSGSSAQRATPSGSPTAAFISASTLPLPHGHRLEFQSGATRALYNYVQLLVYSDFYFVLSRLLLKFLMLSGSVKNGSVHFTLHSERVRTYDCGAKHTN